ncbi:MAG: hypothetical protein HOE90_00865 [Bacteriovoracaceae bacterium]|jgi:ADP-heptose:LPS heptosyltransferase|nr:hypothetical protein [Bacteriovoracaceae bacterium]
MKEILIINLKRLGDVMTTGYIASSLKDRFPQSKITLLTFKVNKKVAEKIENIDHFTYIDREHLLMLKRNRIFNASLLVDSFNNQLRELKNTKWEIVFNYTNDPVSSYLTSFFESESFCGIKHGQQSNIIHSSKASLYLNEVMPSYKYTPLHLQDVYSLIANVEKSNNYGLKSVASNDELCKQKFSSLTKNEDGETTRYTVGIQLKSSSESKDISVETIIGLIKLMRKEERFLPVLLIAPCDKEIEASTHINKFFDNELITIETDFTALPSVLKNLDYLITPCTAIKHAADLCKTKVLEVSMGNAPIFKQGTIGEGNLILSPITLYRPCVTPKDQRSQDDFADCKAIVKSQDIFYALNTLHDPKYHAPERYSQNLTLYCVRNVGEYICYVPIAGDFNVHLELTRIFAAEYSLRLLTNFKGDGFKEHIRTLFKEDELKCWADAQKTSVTYYLRLILTTLRNIKSSQVSQKQSKEFIDRFTLLIDGGDNDHLTSVALNMFRGEVENMHVKSVEQNRERTERLLYGLKNNLQTLNTCIDDFIVYNKRAQILSTNKVGEISY